MKTASRRLGRSRLLRARFAGQSGVGITEVAEQAHGREKREAEVERGAEAPTCPAPSQYGMSLSKWEESRQSWERVWTSRSRRLDLWDAVRVYRIAQGRAIIGGRQAGVRNARGSRKRQREIEPDGVRQVRAGRGGHDRRVIGPRGSGTGVVRSRAPQSTGVGSGPRLP